MNWLFFVSFGTLYVLVGVMIDSLVKIFAEDSPDDMLPGVVVALWPAWLMVFLIYTFLAASSLAGSWLSNAVIQCAIKWRINARNKS